MSNGFYIPPSRLAFIQGLQTDCNQTGVIAVEGPMGIGKTTVLEELLTAVLPNANKCYVTVAESLNDIQIRSRIIEQLFGNVLFDPEKPLLNTFIEFHKSVPILMAIDNGHYLSGQVVGELLQVVAELKKQGLHIVLLISFDKSISNTIGSITSALIKVKPLTGFTSEESYTLLSHSFDNVPSPSSGKVKRWLEDAKGNPTQLLAFDTSESFSVTSPIQFNIKLWASLLIAGSLLLALGIYGYRVFFLKADVAQEPTRTSIAKNVTPAAKPPVVSDWSKAKIDTLAKEQKIKSVTTQSVSNTETKDITDDKKSAFKEIDDTNQQLDESKPQIDDSKLHIDDSKSQIDDSNSQTDPMSPNTEMPKAEETATHQDILSALNLGSVSPVIKPENQDSQPVEQQTSPKVTQEQQPAKPTEAESAQTESQSPAEPEEDLETVELLVAGYPIKTQEMLSLPPNKFVLQLTAVTQEKTLETYLINKSLPLAETRIYRISRNNQPWLILTYGLFDTIADARKAAQTIDPKAWAKSVSVIQQQIKQFNQTLSQ